MPTSDAQGKDVALDWYRQIAPKYVVDIGAGCGTYARLMRDSPDNVLAGDGRLIRRVWPDVWYAVEAWEPYVHEYGLLDLYDSVLLADVRHLNWSYFRHDLVIAGDVLEHMARADAQRLIKRLKYAAANLIISVPVLHLPQDDVNGNPYERHIDHWTAHAMADELGAGVRDSWVGSVLGYWWWSREHHEQR